MTQLSRYREGKQDSWQGRKDGGGATRFHQLVNPFPLDEVPEGRGFAFVGFCCDEGVRRNQGRIGAKEGPESLRKAMAGLPYHGPSDVTFVDVGDIVCEDGDLEAAQEELGEVVNQLLNKKKVPIVLGGGHETAWGHYQGIAKSALEEPLGVVNFDAHFDLRPLLEKEKGSSGTPFLQIAHDRQQRGLSFDYFCLGIQRSGNSQELYRVAHELAVKVVSAEEIQLDGGDRPPSALETFVQDHENLYVSLCLDVFAAPFAPGVSAPQPMGLYPWQVMPYLRMVAASGKVVSFDVVELCPKYDEDQRTARLAASLVSAFIHAFQA